MKRYWVVSAALLTLALLAAACGSSTPAAPAATTVPPTPVVVKETVVVQQTVMVQPTAAPTKAATATTAPTATAAATAAPTAAIQVPADALVQKGRLLICTDFPYPPIEFFDENGNPQGLDIDLGAEIAKRMGLQAQHVNSVFDTIIAAVKGGKCDIIMSDQNITTDRSKAITQIPYFQAGQSMVVAKGNPKGIKTPLDLCGQTAAAETGTTEADYLQATGDYKGGGLPAECAKAGKPAPKAVTTAKDSDALLQLQSGKVLVYFADSPVGAYYTVQHPDQFEIAGQIIEPALVGIGVPCAQEDCTKAPLTPLGKAVRDALKSMMDDGTYVKILTKWKLQDGALKPDQLPQ